MGRILERMGGQIDETVNHNRKIAKPQNFDVRSLFPQNVIPDEMIRELDIAKLRTGTIQSQTITLNVLDGAGDTYLGIGSFDAAAWTATNGILQGIDDSDSNKVKMYVGSATNWWDWNVTTANTLTIAGSLVASQIHIPDENTTANSMHVETDGDTWWGTTHTLWIADNNNATAYILNTGVTRFASVTLTGSVSISGIANSTATDISLLEYTHDLVFSATDADTVAWAAGTITMSNGRTFSISGGNTGNMVAKTFIFLDTTVSSTVLQTATAASSAMGANRILIATAQNGSGQPTWHVYGGAGGLKVGSSGVNIANNNWNFSGAWSVTDADTVAWGAGTLTTSDGSSYSITGSNTGNMVAKTYIYFDLSVSSTAFQTTTTAANAVGDGRVLIAIAQNGTGEATFIVVNDKQLNVDAANIVAGSITANEIAVGTITADRLSVSTLSAITADIGTITSGSITSSTLINTTTLQIGGVSITAIAAELNIMDGITATTAQLNEAGTFFASTDLTGAEAEDLSDGGATTLHSHTSLSGEGMAGVGILADGAGLTVANRRLCIAGNNLYYATETAGTILRYDLNNLHGVPIQNGSVTWTSDVAAYSSTPVLTDLFSDGTYLFAVINYTNTVPATVRTIIRYALGLTGGTVMTISGGTQNQAASSFWDNVGKALYINWNSGSILRYDKYTTSGSPINTFTFSSNFGNFTNLSGAHGACDGTNVWMQNAGVEKWTLATATLVTTYQPNYTIEFDNFADTGNFIWIHDGDNFKGIKKSQVGG